MIDKLYGPNEPKQDSETGDYIYEDNNGSYRYKQ